MKQKISTLVRGNPFSPLLRLKRMSRWMRALILLGAAGLLTDTVSSWTTADLPADLLTRMGLLALGVPSLLLGWFTLLQAWHLFAAYGRGEVFGSVAIGHVRALALALVATALWHIAQATLTVLLQTWHNPPGQRQLEFGLSWEDYLGVLFGGLLRAMAWAMTEAGRIEQDNAGFV